MSIIIYILISIELFCFGCFLIISLNQEIKELKGANLILMRETSDLKSKTKSTEVRTGQIAEQFAPYLSGFPYDPKDVRFLGSPIDMIVFDFKGDQVVLIEFKTGESKESPRQRQIREMIKNGRFIYQVIRVKDEVTIKTADPNTGSYSYE
jgi:predicted Holliday junction resolvase-like endonuclease